MLYVHIHYIYVYTLTNLCTFYSTSGRMAELVASAPAPGKPSPSTSASSVQLKPMSDGPRYAVCSLARYYRLNAFEYDNEPKKYDHNHYFIIASSSYISLYICIQIYISGSRSRQSPPARTALLSPHHTGTHTPYHCSPTLHLPRHQGRCKCILP